MEFVAYVSDDTQIDPFTSRFIVNARENEYPATGRDGRRANSPSGKLAGNRNTASRLGLPNIIRVRREPGENEQSWDTLGDNFNETTGLRIIRNPSNTELFDFYVNIDNKYLQLEQRRQPDKSEILEAQFIYCEVLISMAIIHDDMNKTIPANKLSEANLDLPELVELVTSAIGPVLIPIANELSELSPADIATD